MTFRALCGDAPDTLTKVARFLALLELFRENAVAFEQMSPLGELSVRWTGSDDLDVEADVHIDEFEGAPDGPPTGRSPRPLSRPSTPSRRPSTFVDLTLHPPTHLSHRLAGRARRDHRLAGRARRDHRLVGSSQSTRRPSR